MSDKAERKKELIIKTARELFSKNGFKNVTMKDIVEACDISRGGLYLYYPGTAEIFEDVLKAETSDINEDPGENLKKDSTISDILGVFLEGQKSLIMHDTDDLSVAKYEYYMSHRIPPEKNRMEQNFDDSVEALADLIDDGVESGEFFCDDSHIAARNIMFVCEGLKIASLITDLPEEVVNEQLSYLWGGLLV